MQEFPIIEPMAPTTEEDVGPGIPLHVEVSLLASAAHPVEPRRAAVGEFEPLP